MIYFCHLTEDCFILANSADPGEMLPYAAFHLGHHYLSKYIPVSNMKRVKNVLLFPYDE